MRLTSSVGARRALKRQRVSVHDKRPQPSISRITGAVPVARIGNHRDVMVRQVHPRRKPFFWTIRKFAEKKDSRSTAFRSLLIMDNAAKCLSVRLGFGQVANLGGAPIEPVSQDLSRFLSVSWWSVFPSGKRPRPSLSEWTILSGPAAGSQKVSTSRTLSSTGGSLYYGRSQPVFSQSDRAMSPAGPIPTIDFRGMKAD